MKLRFAMNVTHNYHAALFSFFDGQYCIKHRSGLLTILKQTDIDQNTQAVKNKRFIINGLDKTMCKFLER